MFSFDAFKGDSGGRGESGAICPEKEIYVR